MFQGLEGKLPFIPDLNMTTFLRCGVIFYLLCAALGARVATLDTARCLAQVLASVVPVRGQRQRGILRPQASRRADVLVRAAPDVALRADHGVRRAW